MTSPICNSLPVGVASSNELEVSGDGFPMQPVVTHDLLDQTNGICCICLIKEYHCVQAVLPVHQCLLLGLFNKPCDVRFCDASMYLWVCVCVYTIRTLWVHVCEHTHQEWGGMKVGGRKWESAHSNATGIGYGNQTRVLEVAHILTFIISMLRLCVPCLARSHM